MATGGIDYWRDGRDVPDNIFCIYEYECRFAPAPPAQKESGPPATPCGPPIRRSATTPSKGLRELILGTRGSLLLTSTKGLLFRERMADDVGWARGERR